MGSKAGAEEISDALRTGGESLSETPRAVLTQSAKQPKKKNCGTEAKEEGDRRSEIQEGKKGRREGVKHHTKVRKHQVNFLTQRVENKGRSGTEEVGHNKGKRAEKNEVTHHTKVREHQVYYLAQRIEDKGRRGGISPMRRS